MTSYADKCKEVANMVSVRRAIDIPEYGNNQTTPDMLMLCVDGIPLQGQHKTTLETTFDDLPQFTVVFDMYDGGLKIETLDDDLRAVEDEEEVESEARQGWIRRLRIGKGEDAV